MRRQSRELALQVLFQSEFAPPISSRDVLHAFEETADAETLSYAEELIDGVVKYEWRTRTQRMASVYAAAQA